MLAGAVLFASSGGALADTFTWAQPGDYTGANPEHKYGEPSWSYSTSGGTIAPNGGATELKMIPAQGQSVTLSWASPFSAAKNVSVSGTISQPNPGVMCGFNWSLTNGSATVTSGSDNGTISNTVTVAPGASLRLTVTDASATLFYSASCDTALVSLTLTASGNSTLTLNPPPSEPLATSTPTLTGAAATGPGDASAVAVAIYPGASASGMAVAADTASVGGGGAYSASISTALADGEYTAIAGQHSPSGELVSSPVTFRVKATPPAVTLDQPAAGARTGTAKPVFSGMAGNTADDSTQVTVILHKGASTQGKRVGSMSVTRVGGSWSGNWPKRLSLGRYTAVAQQTDDVGHTGISQSHTFQVVAPPQVIGATVRISRSGIASVEVGCATVSGQRCSGDVRIVTVKSFKPTAGGPRGPLQLMFAYINIPAGQTVVVRRSVPSDVVRTLRHAGKAKVRVTTTLSQSAGSPTTVSAIRTLSL